MIKLKIWLKNELNATSEYVAGILNILEDANVSNTMNQYAISSEVNITLFSPDYGYYNMVWFNHTIKRNNAKILL